MRRWARRIDGVVLFVTPLLTMTALLLAVALPYVAVRQSTSTPASCTLVGSTWSCPRPVNDPVSGRR
ncbi:MAG: hypothetical protein ACJ73S_29520 [Mycobacteriales bacterium]